MTEYWTPVGIFGAGAVDGATYFYASTAAASVADALARRDLDALHATGGRHARRRERRSPASTGSTTCSSTR
jgi:hypothetical protein